ncbi:sensor histidine kinase [Glutamicibacter protophormiae]|uniref:sensor histidine kinase n=1 Tax=Glutamicibacter protophormiae TaxID=37930 RepID=UPI001956AF81|nr:sensor histidine kinase [Glutamicibacter protophormiae]QRQ79574.1 sensor histidine kinase [Glutamicibacter protophormiae]WPR65701.1 sensor histidine kinase [Glutamicibacter protophormiae]WPR69198.1 sensor histidine kinase [Glutamicibacter protophormiae]
MSPALQITLIVTIVTVGIAVIGYFGFKISRSTKEMGTDADEATFTTLHHMSVAVPHLERGLTVEGAAKSAKALRKLLNCPVLLISDTRHILATDAGIEFTADLEEQASETFATVLATGKTQVKRLSGQDFVAAPIMVGNQPVGTVTALSPRAGAGFVRAVSEVAVFVSAQVSTAQLDENKAMLLEAQMRALRAQISPHFIYNSLNAIASFINTDPARARELVIEFADFTRYSFRRRGEFTTLAEELEAIDRYLLLEKARFGDRIRVSLQIAPEVLPTKIPFLSLQPLVENAVRHGLEARPDGGVISITATEDGMHAVISVEDDGVGMDPEQLASVLAGTTVNMHVGLRNVDVRLRQLYGNSNGLIIDTAPGAGTQITLRIPKFLAPGKGSINE